MPNTESFTVNEVLVYLRKSRSDSPDMSVEEVLRKHEEMIQSPARRSIPDHR